MVEIENRKNGLNWKLVFKAIVFFVLTVILFGLPLFLSAGNLKFWNAWLFIGAFSIPVFFILIYLAIKDPDLFEKRMRTNEKGISQNIYKTLLTFVFITTLIVSGFDHRYHWSRVPILFVIIFTIVMLCGIIMLFITMQQNSYASRVIEIQEGQKIIDTGLYSVVRHPMYLAYSIIFCFSPLVLGSFYALIPVLFMPLLIAMRIKNEEKVLQEGLKGYDLYMKRVKYRLTPYIW